MQLRAGKKMETVALDEFMEFTPVLHPDTENGKKPCRLWNDVWIS
jgi:hypothetical protein